MWRWWYEVLALILIHTAAVAAADTQIPSGQPSGQPTGQPSGQPSGSPSIQPTTSPTTSPRPTPAPTVKFGPVVGAQLVYSVFYKGDSCKSAPLGFSLKSAFPLDQCLVSNSAVTQYRPYTLGCKAGLDRLSVVKTLYADFACRQEQPASTDVVLYHVDPGCAPVKKTAVSPGPFSETQCTASLPYELWNREQVVLQAYRSPNCVGGLSDDGGNPEVVSYFLGMCYALSRTEWRKLTYVSGDGIASDIIIRDDRYPDAFCSGDLRPSSIVVTFPATDGTTCQANPLQPLSYYAGAFRTLSLREDSREWVGLFPSAFGGLPSSAPTNSPTAAPTAIPDGGTLCEFFNTVPLSGKASLVNWCTTPFNPCQTESPWTGVTCSSVGSLSRVTSIDLTGKSLGGGRIPASIGDLDLLTALVLSGAEIGKLQQFPLPSRLGLLTGLQKLDLGGSRFEGGIPTELGLLTALTFLGLDGPSSGSYSSLNGQVPTQLQGLTALQTLKLNNNLLSSSLPTFFGSLSGLTSLQLDGNSFTGQVPSSLCSLASMKDLDVSNNALDCAPACFFSTPFSLFVSLGGLSQCLTDTSLDGAALCALKTAAAAAAAVVASTSLSGTKLEGWCDGVGPYNPCGNTPWSGITCAAFDDVKRITKIDISSGDADNTIRGSLPTALARLDKLVELNMSSNSFSGSLPAYLGSFTGLTTLDMSSNSFGGTLPSSLGGLTRLVVLDLSLNAGLQGTIPSSFGGLSLLTSLQLGSTGLTGAAPSSLCNINSLPQHLALPTTLTCTPSCLQTQGWTGVTRIGTCPSASTHADGVALCQFSSSLTSSSTLTNWCSYPPPYNPCLTGSTKAWFGVTCVQDRVKSINLASSSLVGGSLPSSLGSLGAVTSIVLTGNSIAGSLPSSLGALSALVVLDVSANNFAGSLPTTLGLLSALTRLNVGTNSLVGSLPTQLFALTGLRRLSLSNNQLTGTLSGSVGGMVGLTSLSLASNSFRGSLPSALAQLGALRVLDVQSNVFTGTLAVSVVTALTSLQVLALGANSLRGSLPSELGSLSGLKNLTLSYNAFTGAAPASLCRLPRTAAIQFVSTGISCKFSCLTNPPFTNLYTTVTSTCDIGLVEGAALCDLYSRSNNKPALANWCGAKNADGSYVYPPCSSGLNSWAGVNCTTLQGTPRVTRLSMINTGLTGGLPSSLGSMGALTFLSLGANALVGSVPSSIAQLTALLSLDLGNNMLGGSLPSSMQSMFRLQLLHLGGNALVGSVPAWVSGLSALTALDLSYNSLAGALPTTLGLMTKLQSLALDGNKFSRSLPPALGQLSSIKNLWLFSNAFTGPVPSSLCALTAIVDLQLQQNPGLACFPTCFTAVPRIAAALQKDTTGNCSSAPTPAPVAPTRAPSAWPTAAVPTLSPSSPSLSPTVNSLPPIFADFYVTTTSANSSFTLASPTQAQGKMYAFQVANAAAASPRSTSSASFKVTPRSTVTVSYLVVGGGGGGGAWGGGGGGGQVQMGTVTLLGNTTYTVTVGNGGRAVPTWGAPSKGGDSSIVGGGVNIVSFGGSSGYASALSYSAGYYASPSSLSLSGSTRIDTIAVLPAKYQVSFDFVLYSNGPSGNDVTQNIIHIGSVDQQRLPSLFIKGGGPLGWWPAYGPSGTEVRATESCTAAIAVNAWMTVTLAVDTTARTFSFTVTTAGSGANYMAACSGSTSITSVQTAGQIYTNVPIWTNFGASSSINGNIKNLVIAYTGASDLVTRKLTTSLPASFYTSSPYTITASNQVDTIATLPAAYQISLDVWVNAHGGQWQSLLLIGAGNSNRMPALFLREGTGWWPEYNKFGNEVVAVNTCTAPVALNTWMKVMMAVDLTARTFSFFVAAAGTMAACSGTVTIPVGQTTGTNTNVPIWATYNDYLGVNAKIRNLVIAPPGFGLGYGSGGGCWGAAGYSMASSGCNAFSSLTASSFCSGGGNTCSGSGFTQSSGGGGGAGGAGGEPTSLANGDGGPGVSFLCTAAYYGGGGGGGGNCNGRVDANTPGSAGVGGAGGGGTGGACVTGSTTVSPLINGANGVLHSGGGGGGGAYMFTSPTSSPTQLVAMGSAGKGGSGAVLLATNLYCTRPPTMSPTLFTPLSIIYDWQSRMDAAGTSVSDKVVAAASKFFNALTVAGMTQKISRLNLFSGQDLKAALLPLIYQPSTSKTDTVVGGSGAFTYDQYRGVWTNNIGGWINTNQRISHVDQNNDNSAPADGSNVHMSMFFMDPYPGGRTMGVWRASGYSRHYLLTDWTCCAGWGYQYCTECRNDAGLWAITSDTTKTHSSASSPFFRTYCALDQGAQCTRHLEGGGDASTPADWPVGLFAAYGSNPNGCGPKAGQSFYENYGQNSKCTIDYTGETNAICNNMRIGAYSIGYALTQAEINVLNGALIQYFNDIGRF